MRFLVDDKLGKWNEFKGDIYDHKNKVYTLSDSQAQYLKQTYYACISYIDSLVGELVDEVK